MKTKIALTASLAVLLAVPFLFADDPDGAAPPFGPPSVQTMDDNGDGQVSREEFDRHTDPFTRLDKNGDGVLTQDELDARPFRGRGPGGPGCMGPGQGGRFDGDGPRPGGGFLLKAADQNDDGTLTRGDWDAWVAAQDKDGNGELNAAELSAIAPSQRARARHGERLLASLDTDQNGSLSRAELDTVFTDHDRNGNGTIDQDEVPCHHDRRGRGGFGPHGQGGFGPGGQRGSGPQF